MKTRITNINQLQPGDRIFTVNHDGAHEILEFREIHPHHDGYSLFLNENKDGMHKFYNKTLEDKEYYLYDDSDECRKFIYKREIAAHKRCIELIEKRMKPYTGKPSFSMTTHTISFNCEPTPEVREAWAKMIGSDELDLYGEWPDGFIRQIAKITRAEDCPRELFMDTVKGLQLKAR